MSCAICLVPCPEDCILEEDEQFVIDREHCTECGDCIPVCPLSCIVSI